MTKKLKYITRINLVSTIIFIFLISCNSSTQNENTFSTYQPTPIDASPMVYWYWNDAAVSKEGITTDLEAMKDAGLEGAYLFFIRGASDRVKFDKPVVQLTHEWWEMVKFAFSEAARLGLKLGLHSCDGFTVAGGPWITPELSMQKVVWSDTIIEGGNRFIGKLRQPETIRDYYEDLKVFAIPLKNDEGLTSYLLNPKVTSSIPGNNPQYLNDPATPERFRSDEPCWVQYEFKQPFTCRSIVIKKAGNIFQAERLILEVSNNGKNFDFQTRLQPQRQGWMDGEKDITFFIEPVKARYFRFVYYPEGTEPGAEDLDAAKWPQSLKIAGIELSSDPKIHQYEGKNGSIWRIAGRITQTQLPDSLCVQENKILDISSFLNDNGEMEWDVPKGKWKIFRMGHTSTGKTNYIGGGAVGLECDKLNPAAAVLQFDKWLGEFYRQVGDNETSKVLKYFHVDSWECGSQNWSPVFIDEFRKRRGYDIVEYLPVFAGIPIENTEFSENILHDVRQTISELLTDNFYGTFEKMAHKKGLLFSAESVAPVMVADGMLHQKNVDIPMGEFWLNSPTHDKPNDILDAVSAAHIYGKKIIQSESFTEIRIDWNEHPGMLKTLSDRNFALGINRLVFHVFCHNPWPERKPGMTLGVVGMVYQPTQTWFQQGKAWIDYIRNCQELLQQGVPVTDIAVFTGEEIPRRAVLPDRFVNMFPEIFGEEVIQREKIRLENKGIPVHEQPKGVTVIKNVADPADWVDPLHGYAYDSFNRDALLRLAKVNNGRVEFPGGASYGLLVIPGSRRMMPDGNVMSAEVVTKVLELVKAGATVIMEEKPEETFSPFDKNESFENAVDELFSGNFEEEDKGNFQMKKLGKGRIVTGKFNSSSYKSLGIEKDFYALDENGKEAENLAWNHRVNGTKEIYFISNQKNLKRELELSFRISGKIPELYFPVSGEKKECKSWHIENGRTIIPLSMENNESLFVIYEKETSEIKADNGKNRPEFEPVLNLGSSWQVQFDESFGGPENQVEFNTLSDWSKNKNDKIKFYSGTAVYRKSFDWQQESGSVWIDVGEVNNLGEVKVNGIDCGVAWTAPFRVDISKALKTGKNELEISVTNTWANRLIGDHNLPENERITWTTAAYRLEGQLLLPAGLLGPVNILKEK